MTTALNTSTLFDKIHYYEGVIEDPATLLNLINSTDVDLDDFTSITKWKKWSASNDEYVFGEQKFINSNIDKESNSLLVYINKQINDAIYKSSQIYAKKYNIDLGHLTPLSISKYYVGKHMGSHVDSYGDDRSPILSVVLYLNDDYEGGELYFKNQSVMIKPTAGSIVIFPSNEPYYHESKEIRRGVKYMSPGFWYKN